MTMEEPESQTLRVLSVDLPTGDSELEPWESTDPVEERIGRAGGSSLAAALLSRSARLDADAPPFVIALGAAVKAGLPTAARATVASRAPMTGAYADGQVGSDLARRLARMCDAVVLSGRTERGGAVLEIREDGSTELFEFPELAGATPVEIARVLHERFGECATLRVGPSAAAGVRFASLIAGTSPPSMVGRGGLGFAFAQTGLIAVAVTASREKAIEDASARAAIEALLLSSPRLALRSEGGTLELAQARAARGELRGRGSTEAVSTDEAEDWDRSVDVTKKTKHGCAGCPTPCGYVFETGGKNQPARFSVFEALGWNLGLDDPADSLRLLRTCDEWGIDAKESGAILALLAKSESALFGDVEGLLAILRKVASGEFEAAKWGAAELARACGASVPQDSGVAQRAETNLAVRLGAKVACRGSEPMRTHPFLVDGSVRGSRLEQLFAPFELEQGSEDPLSPIGKGRVVWWHENLTAAIDASGFCAFSAASLLADGVISLDDLASAVAPSTRPTESGQAWLEIGAATLLLIRDLNQTWGAELAPPESGEPVFREAGMISEYLEWRGLDKRGNPRADWRERVLDGRLLELGTRGPAVRVTKPSHSTIEREPRKSGNVNLRAFGSLGAKLGAAPIEFELPCPLAELINEIACRIPDAAPSLLSRGEILPAVYREGARLLAEDQIRAGDSLDFVLVTAGG